MRYYFIILYWYLFNKKRWKEYKVALDLMVAIKEQRRKKKKVKRLKELFKEYVHTVLKYNFENWR